MGRGSQKGRRGGNRSGAASFGGHRPFGWGQGRKSRNRKPKLIEAQSDAAEQLAANHAEEVATLKRQASDLSKSLAEVQTRIAELEAGAAENAPTDV